MTGEKTQRFERPFVLQGPSSGGAEVLGGTQAGWQVCRAEVRAHGG